LRVQSSHPRCSNYGSGHGIEGASLGEVEQLYNYKDFAGFLTAFKDVTGHLRTPEDYELIAYRLMERLKAQNVLHAEVIISAGVCLWRKQDFPAIFEGLERGRQRGEKDFGLSLLWIFDAIRQSAPRKPQRVLDLAIQFRDRNVVAFGIGGDERAGPPEWFAGFMRAPPSTVFISRRTRLKAPGRIHLGRAESQGGTHWPRPYRRAGSGVIDELAERQDSD